MPRKVFVEDLAKAAQPGKFSNISALRRGEDDGQIIFTCTSSTLPPAEVIVVASVTDVGDYPSNHGYVLYLSDENAITIPPEVSSALEDLQPSMYGCRLSQVLVEISSSIGHLLSSGQSHNPMELDHDLESEFEPDDILDGYDIDGDIDDDILFGRLGATSPSSNHLKEPKGTDPELSLSGLDTPSQRRCGSDLRATKLAGFKVGMLGDLNSGGFVCVSSRVVKLGISEEAMQAWSLQRNHYLVLMIRFEHGYRTVEQLGDAKGKVEMRVALSESYKPTLADAINAFSPTVSYRSAAGPIPDSSSESTTRLVSLFIGRPINDLLKHRFAAIVKYRLSCCFTWTGSERFVNDIQGKATDRVDDSNPAYFGSDVNESRNLPTLVTADNIGESVGNFQKMSLPLIAMQFVLRHFVRCTEFCLVCHCKIEANFEALKPYVCSKPLCLYQYMRLGFGPSAEWEIISQPYVVDLLITFCYASAQQGQLKDFPTGMDLRVPGLPQLSTTRDTLRDKFDALTGLILPKPNCKEKSGTLSSTFSTKFDARNMELVFADQKKTCPVRPGDWLVVVSESMEGLRHARVQETMYPIVKLSKAIIVHRTSCSSQASDLYTSRSTNDTHSTMTQEDSPLPQGLINAECYVYNKSFDEMTESQKRNCVIILLDTLPDVKQMRDHLNGVSFGQEPSLRTWRDRISEAALNMLQWIIASNRSCIMQVDHIPLSLSGNSSTGPPTPALEYRQPFAATEDRIYGMDGWMQFRFAQGAPDKEQRFINCVKEVAVRTQNKSPTLFAWHGSTLANWHSIIRQGLHFEKTIHGRAYGHGVYMSPYSTTAGGYSHDYSSAPYQGSMTSMWPNSKLRISCALALNEVVNAPSEFVSRKPHYVVNKIEWIQTRYLFVRVDQNSLHLNLDSKTKPSRTYQQDPKAQAFGDSNEAILIPISGVSKPLRPAVVTSPQLRGDRKKSKSTVHTDQESKQRLEDDAASVVTEDDDRKILLSSDEDEVALMSQIRVDGSPRTKRKAKSLIMTDFVPGKLDLTTLKLLKEPKNTSIVTTKQLSKAVREVRQVQQDTPSHELGWYIDTEKIDNLYQWIVEMHSFDAGLPLAKDMKAVGLTSIILEMRFTNRYPISPPFVRVIRPRFLPFMSGGGGHVTAGGALCMELLTDTAWLPTMSIEAVLVQIRLELSSLNPPARLESRSKGYIGHGGDAYSIAEAIAAYKRACITHGWMIPPGFDTLSQE